MAFKCARNTEKVVLSCRMYINPHADAMLVELIQTYGKYTFCTVQYHYLYFVTAAYYYCIRVIYVLINLFFKHEAQLVLRLNSI